MNNEIEKTFYDTFGIERKRNHEVTLEAISGGVKSANLSQKPFYEYPQITDHILLELICIANQYEDYPISTNIKNIQARTLRILLRAKKYLKDTYPHQGCHNGLVRKVRTLFKEVKNEKFTR